MIESTGAEADDTIAVVLAGGKGTRLDPLTRHICKPALPFGGAFRSIDFTLSNCANSGVRTIGAATQYKPAVLLSHLARAWRGAADDGPEVVAWRAEEQAPDTGYRGTADAVYRNLDRIRSDGARLVLVLAGDHVYKMDYRPMLEAHCARRADVTVGVGRRPGGVRVDRPPWPQPFDGEGEGEPAQGVPQGQVGLAGQGVDEVVGEEPRAVLAAR